MSLTTDFTDDTDKARREERTYQVIDLSVSSVKSVRSVVPILLLWLHPRRGRPPEPRARPLQNQHCIAIAEEAVLLGDRGLIGFTDEVGSRKRTDQHEQC